jgi:hypothetical protein
MLKNHSMMPTWAGVFAGLIPPDGEVPSISRQMPSRARSVTHVKIALLEARRPFLVCSFSNGVFSGDSTNVSGGLCSFEASIELVKMTVSEMFILLNLTLYSSGPENFVPLV